MAISKRGNKEVDSFSIQNKSYYLEVFYLDVLSIKLHGKPYKEIDKSLQDETKEYIRTVLLKDIQMIPLNKIRELILIDLCAEEYKDAIKACLYK